MPVSVWQDVVDLHFPGSAWLRCRRETLDALAAFKAERALPTWDATLETLLAEAAAARPADASADTPTEAPDDASTITPPSTPPINAEVPDP
jgi:hypothetical protein